MLLPGGGLKMELYRSGQRVGEWVGIRVPGFMESLNRCPRNRDLGLACGKLQCLMLRRLVMRVLRTTILVFGGITLILSSRLEPSPGEVQS